MKRIALFAVLIMALLAGRLAAESDGDHWICQAVAMNYSQDGRQAEWDPTLKTWKVWNQEDLSNPLDGFWEWYPVEDIFEIEIDLLYASPEMTNGPAYQVMYSANAQQLWIFAYKTLTDGGTANPGFHDTCDIGPWVYDLKKES